MLSLHTNAAALSAQNSISRTQTSLSTSMTRLSTGFRINSAMDDAAGLQIATRLKTQTSGMSVAMRNTQNSISLMQTSEGALDETTNILNRMKDLATQAADGSSTTADQTAMQKEYDSLSDELSNIFNNTKFGGTTLLQKAAGASPGKLSAAITFQIGASTGETLAADFTAERTQAATDILAAAAGFKDDGTVGAAAGVEISTAGAANASINKLATAIDSVSAMRSKLGAVSNRLDHVYNNLSNISTNTKNATGRIMDVDFASESATMTSSQMLLQAGTAMLKQSNSQSSLVLSLLQ
ncbi:flagellin N-terminal helical domain-containing protein [Pseudoduganella violaceinigra]|uniref:flagellin N-terminal helical domain-containing protein n=1 Tax=Pseudoduganella violaceinigra TaxID=246602 RepID=UPI0003FBF756|nr:flagellin [Pseudoduganella violaceinigra]